MPPGHGGAFSPISIRLSVPTTTLTSPSATATAAMKASPSPSPTATTRATTILISSISPPSTNPAPTTLAVTISAANMALTPIIATKLSTISTPASTITTIPPLTPAPADRLLYNGGLLAWSFLTMAILGMIVVGGVVCWNKRAKDDISIVRGVTSGRGGRGGRAVHRIADGRYRAVAAEIQQA